MQRLLAKSSRDGSTPKTLPEHTEDVLNAISALFGTPESPTRLAKSWLRFFGLTEGDFRRFLHHLRVAAAAHDWGKANEGFQSAVLEGGEQVIRHEHISGLMLADLIEDSRILLWLKNAGIDETILLVAVISHHLKVSRKGDHALGAYTGKRDTLRLLSDHHDFAMVWQSIRDAVGPPCLERLQFQSLWRRADIRSKIKLISSRLEKEASRLRDDPIGRRWIGAIRAALIVADAVGSAVVRMNTEVGENAQATIDRWARDCFSIVLTGNDIWTNVTKKRIAELRNGKRWNDATGEAYEDECGFSEFQVSIVNQGPRVLLRAPCGSGKTLAAWNWIKAQLDDRPAARVLFLYPTRATATEGFRDYVSWAPEDDAGLLSGTADYELQDMFETPDDTKDARHHRNYRSDPRLYALGHWKKRVFSATADQFFPFMQYGYGPICLLPLLVESVLVVDEVHSFDKSMFSTLRRFLKEFPSIPVLCMTATLSNERRSSLIGCGLKPYPEPPPANLVDDAKYPRYHIEWVGRTHAEVLAMEGLRSAQRVLWVSNRVTACQQVFESLRDEDDEGYIGPGAVKSFCYHSRFKLRDRKEKHRELIQAFKDAVKADAAPQAILGATTQVCEMSLDLDTEILVTELAPVASLIQRMGRCNRDSTKMRTRPIGRVYVLLPEPGKEKPYEKEELAVAKKFVDKLAGKDVSQAELEDVYRQCDPGEVEPLKLCPFLDSGPYAEGREESFREIDEFTVPCILDDDVPKVLDKIDDRKPIDGFIVPVPQYLAMEPGPGASRLPRWLRIADGKRYDTRIGFDNRPRPDSEGGRSS